MTDDAPSASWDRIRLRAGLLRRLRQFFDERGFLEVETPLLLPELVLDDHLEPFATRFCPDPRRPDQGTPLWLQSSPEAAMKRLMAHGGEALYQVTRSFRNGERGSRHHPEFTIVEWYRRGDRMQQGIELLSELCGSLLDTPPAERLSYADAFQRAMGCDPHVATVAELAAAARRQGLSPPQDLGHDDRNGWLDLCMALRVEGTLGRQRPTILYHYPATQAALARVRDCPESGAPVAERFELFYRGLELANGYHELTDPVELQRRCEVAITARAAAGLPTWPSPERLLTSQRRGLPPCCGVALGFDRVLMLAAGAETIEEVLTFPLEC